jgi:hypothetical protein
MKIHSKDFCVQEGEQVDLKKWPTLVKPAYKSKKKYKKYLKKYGSSTFQMELNRFPSGAAIR